MRCVVRSDLTNQTSGGAVHQPNSRNDLLSIFGAACNAFFQGSLAQGGNLVLQFKDHEHFILIGETIPVLIGTASSTPKIMDFCSGTKVGIRRSLQGLKDYGHFLVISCQRKRFHVRSVNVQKIARYLKQHAPPRRALTALPKLAVFDLWPFDEVSWEEMLRRLLSMVQIMGRTTYLYDEQGIWLDAKHLKYWESTKRKIGSNVKIPLPTFAQSVWPDPGPLTYKRLRRFEHARAY